MTILAFSILIYSDKTWLIRRVIAYFVDKVNLKYLLLKIWTFE